MAKKILKKETPQEQEVLSPEEIKKQRKELMDFYKDEMPLLKERADYENLITKIEEARFQRFQIRTAKAQMLSPDLPDGPHGHEPEMPNK